MNAVITIAPRRRNLVRMDHNNSIHKTSWTNIPIEKTSGTNIPAEITSGVNIHTDKILKTNTSNLCLISCVIQVDYSIGIWKTGELTTFMNDFILNHLSLLRHKVCYSKYNIDIDHGMIIQTKKEHSTALKSEKSSYYRYN